MKRSKLDSGKKILALVMAAALLLLAACTTTATTTTTPAPSPGTPPPEVTQYAKDWPLPGKDYNNTRATTDSAINSSNVEHPWCRLGIQRSQRTGHFWLHFHHSHHHGQQRLYPGYW